MDGWAKDRTEIWMGWQVAGWTNGLTGKWADKQPGERAEVWTGECMEDE